jgi:hypothetical protein
MRQGITCREENTQFTLWKLEIKANPITERWGWVSPTATVLLEGLSKLKTFSDLQPTTLSRVMLTLCSSMKHVLQQGDGKESKFLLSKHWRLAELFGSHKRLTWNTASEYIWRYRSEGVHENCVTQSSRARSLSLSCFRTPSEERSSWRSSGQNGRTVRTWGSCDSPSGCQQALRWTLAVCLINWQRPVPWAGQIRGLGHFVRKLITTVR